MIEDPHFLFEHLVNGCENLARVSEKARDGPSKTHRFTSCVVIQSVNPLFRKFLMVVLLFRERGKTTCLGKPLQDRERKEKVL